MLIEDRYVVEVAFQPSITGKVFCLSNTGEVFLWVGTETKRLTSAELYVHTLCRSEKDYLDDIETLEACVESLSTEWYWYRSRQVASLYILIIVDNVRDRGAVEGEADADTTRDRGAVEGVTEPHHEPAGQLTIMFLNDIN